MGVWLLYGHWSEKWHGGKCDKVIGVFTDEIIARDMLTRFEKGFADMKDTITYSIERDLVNDTTSHPQMFLWPLPEPTST